jgi:hypothetical protein
VPSTILLRASKGAKKKAKLLEFGQLQRQLTSF